MRRMEKKDIMHLASLSRIRISQAEAEAFTKEIDAILEYVGAVNEITADVSLTKKVGVRHNIFREDKVTNDPEFYTQAHLRKAPHTSGR